MVRLCPNCRERNPKYRGSCRRCNSPLSHAARERRREQIMVDELRESNGKEPVYNVPEIKDVEPVERSNGGAFYLVLGLLFVAGVAYVLWSGGVL